MHDARPCAYCEEPATRGELCRMHSARKRRGAPMHAPRQERLSPKERHRANALAYADAEEDEINTAAVNLDKAAQRHVFSKHLSKAAHARWKLTSERQRKGVGRMLADARAKARAQKNCDRSELNVHAHKPRAARTAAAESVPPVADDSEHEQTVQAGQQTSQRVREGQERQPGRAAEVREGDPRSGHEQSARGARAAAASDARPRSTSRGARGGSDPRSRRAQAILSGAGTGGADQP